MSESLIQYRKNEEMTQETLADALGTTKATVCKWEKGRIPAERVLDVERVTGIPRYELRPDIYGEAPEPQDAA